MALVFADAASFIALISDDDRYHEAALGIQRHLDRENASLITTNHIVDETCSWLLRYRAVGHGLAVEFGQTISACPSFIWDQLPRRMPVGADLIVVYTTPAIESRAWDIFAKYDTAGFSFTDCVSFAVMQALGIKKAFTFDEHYDVMGFERLQATST